MNSVGIDLHRNRSHITVIDGEGTEVLSRRITNDRATFLEILDGLHGETQIAVEATYGWEWLVDALEDAGHEVHLSHPLRTRAIAAARVKTDAVDARTLAQLLMAGLLPEAYVAPREVRDLRDLLRHRLALTQLRAAVKNRVHAQLARQGVKVTRTDLFGKGGRELMAGLGLRDGQRRRLDSMLSLVGDFDREIGVATAEVDALAKADERVEVLTQIRGVGVYTAMLIIAEVGDVSRFPDARRLCAWAGLTPTIRSSDGKARLGHITKQGSSPLRWVLVEAAQHIRAGEGSLGEAFERIAERRGRKIARVAVARKILTLCFYGLRDGEIRCLARRCRPGAAAVMAASS